MAEATKCPLCGQELRCRMPPELSVRPDGIHELESACVYEEIERYRNVTVSVNRCVHCGHVMLEWYRQPDTEQIDIETEV